MAEIRERKGRHVCSMCGSVVASDAPFCQVCRTSFDGSPVPPEPPRAKGTGWTFWSWFGLGVALYIVLFGVVLFHLIRWLVGVANEDPRAHAWGRTLRASSIALLLTTPIVLFIGLLFRLIR